MTQLHDQEPMGYPPRWEAQGTLSTGSGGGRAGRARSLRALTWLSWIVIAAVCGFLFVSPMVLRKESEGKPNPKDPIGLVIFRLQGMYMVGAASLESGSGGMVYAQAEVALNKGSVEQRQRFVVLSAELMGAREATDQLSKLQWDIDTRQSQTADEAEPFVLTPEQERVQGLLHSLYGGMGEATHDQEGGGESSLAARVELLSEDDQQFLRDELGWFGELALLPSDTRLVSARIGVLAPARTVVFVLLGVLIGLGVIGVFGLVGLIVLLILAALGKVRSRVLASPTPHGIYAETFAVWLIVFFGAQVGVGLYVRAAGLSATFELGLTLAVFFFSLVSLAWPKCRGVSWKQVRTDIGWTLGRVPQVESVVGVAGYAMALPLLGIGLLLTLLLMAIEKAYTPEEVGNMFAPMSGPAHPIVLEVAGPGVGVKLLILVLAAIAAPIVEETMFRGVLYRHLRDTSRSLGAVLSVIFSGFLSGFLFAAIHPQGWVAIPALMGLAWAFVILREWRGTVVPAMVVHGISNGLVISMLIVLLGMG